MPPSTDKEEIATATDQESDALNSDESSKLEEHGAECSGKEEEAEGKPRSEATDTPTITDDNKAAAQPTAPSSLEETRSYAAPPSLLRGPDIQNSACSTRNRQPGAHRVYTSRSSNNLPDTTTTTTTTVPDNREEEEGNNGSLVEAEVGDNNNNNDNNDEVYQLEATAVDDIVEVHARPIEWWTPHKIMWVVGGTLIVLAFIVTVATTTTVVVRQQPDGNDNPQGTAPTMPPLERRRAMQEVLLSEAYAGNGVNATTSSSTWLLHDSSTPQNKALEWLAVKDDYYVSLDDVDHLVQRYSLAVLFFATGGSVVNDTSSRWVESFEFLQPTHECSWSGALRCGRSGDVVTGIELQSNGLEGQLPGIELGFLSHLISLSLGNNALSGQLPVSLQLQHLAKLDLARNSFSGSIPNQWTEMTQLRHLDIQRNMLKGTIPKDFGALSRLTSLDMGGNLLTGVIPESLWENLSKMEVFITEKQKVLNGAISPAIGRWSNLRVFKINDMNSNVTGSIPTEVGLLTSLVQFKTSQSNMASTLPSELGLLTNMFELALSRNGYTGTVPTELALLTNLEELYMQSTWLSGDMSHFCKEMDAGKMPKLLTLIADKEEVHNCTCCTCCDYRF